MPGATPTVVADIYSMGVSLFHMLSGSLPFGTNVEARRGVASRRILICANSIRRSVRRL